MNAPSPWMLRPPKGTRTHRWQARRLVCCLVLLLGGLLLASCASPADTSAPTVVQTSPAKDAKGVATDAELSIIFSKAMNEPSVQVNATPDPGLDSGRWTDPETVVFHAPSGWQPDTAYTVSIAGRDLAGKPLAAGTSFLFHTAATTSIGAPATPTHVLAEADDGSFDLTWSANSEPDLAGYTVYWGPANGPPDSALFVAAPATSATITDVHNAQPYDVTVDAVDTAGQHSDPSAPVVVTPADATPPALTSSEPADGSSGLTLVPVVRLTFSEPMTTGSLVIRLCTSTEPPAQATCPNPTAAILTTPTWSADDTVATVNTSSHFTAGTTYVLAISASDAAGNTLAAPAPIAFSLASVPDTTPPTVRAASGPTQATPSFGFDFSEAMDQASVEAAFLSQPAVTCRWTWVSVTATCAVTSGLEQLTDYVVTIATTATDTAGNPMAAPFQTTLPTSDFSPTVIGVQPPGGDFNVAATSPITLSFSEPMKPSATSTAFTVTTNVAVAGSTAWNATRTQMVFTPSTSYGHGANVRWTLSTAATDAGGKALANQVSGSFRTEPVFQAVR